MTGGFCSMVECLISNCEVPGSILGRVKINKKKKRCLLETWTSYSFLCLHYIILAQYLETTQTQKSEPCVRSGCFSSWLWPCRSSEFGAGCSRDSCWYNSLLVLTLVCIFQSGEACLFLQYIFLLVLSILSMQNTALTPKGVSDDLSPVQVPIVWAHRFRLSWVTCSTWKDVHGFFWFLVCFFL